MEKHRDKAARLFKEGYNCSQAVFGAYADEYGIDAGLAFKLSASFGGGMGRMREVCGAVSGMLMVAGLETGTDTGKDFAGKQANYDMVQKLAAEYKKSNGSIICKELLGLVPMQNSDVNGVKHHGAMTQEDKKELLAAGFEDTKPAKRDGEYYKKRPCVALVMEACDILDRILFEDREQ